MPSKANIKSPVVLIAHGRSGTSLLMKIFQMHPEFEVVGETAPLIFGVWYSMEKLKGIVRPRLVDDVAVDFKARCANCVQSTFLSEFPASKPRWMQKPIGVPFVYWNEKTRGASDEEFAEWYWLVITTSFPEAKFITILRDPRDVVLSSMEYWGSSQKAAWNNISLMAKILNSPNNKIAHCVSYGALIGSPQENVNELFRAVEAPFNPRVLKAFENVYVPYMGRQSEDAAKFKDRQENNFKRSLDWAKLDMNLLRREDRAELELLWSRFGNRLPF
jgi:hypothetical protein